jgi:hypothetical protein
VARAELHTGSRIRAFLAPATSRSDCGKRPGVRVKSALSESTLHPRMNVAIWETISLAISRCRASHGRLQIGGYRCQSAVQRLNASV